MKAFSAFLIFALASLTSFGATFSVGDFEYSTGNGRYYLNGLTAAAKAKNLTQITIPGFVTYQGVTLPTYISPSAFEDNTKLSVVVIKYGTLAIGYDAFAKCSALSEIHIPSSCASIGDYAFSEAGNSSKDMTIWYSRLTKPSVTATSFFGFKAKSVSIIVPTIAAVKKFKSDTYITNFISNISSLGLLSCDVMIGNNCYVVSKAPVTSGNTLLSDGELTLVGANSGALSLTKDSECFTRDMGDGWYYVCTSVADSAFVGYEVFSSITITYPDVKRIGRYAFANTKNVGAVTVKSDTISYGAFYGSSLTSLTMNEGTRFLFNGALYNCANLTTVNIPASLYSFGDMTNYSYNKSMARYIVASDNTRYSSDSQGALYDKPKTTLFHFPPTATLSSLPSTITTIDRGAFYNFKGKSITVPHGTLKINDLAFSFASSLEYLKIPSTVTSISENSILDGCTALKELVITTMNPTLLPTFNQMFGSTKVPSSLKIRVPQRTLDICKQYWSNHSGKIKPGAYDIWRGTSPALHFCILNKPKKECYITFGDIDYTNYHTANTSGNIVIPASLTYNDITYTVKAIDENAYYGASGLTELVLPEGLTTVGNNFIGGNASSFLCYVPNAEWNKYMDGTVSFANSTVKNGICPYLRSNGVNNLSFAPAVNVKLPTDSEIRFYKVTDGDYNAKEMKTVMYHPGSNVAKSEGMIVDGITSGKVYRMPRATAAVSISPDNMLVGVTQNVTVNAVYSTSARNYYYSDKQFHAISGSRTITAGKAYLAAPQQPTSGIATLNVDIFNTAIKGDVNADGVVNVSDVTTLVNMILGITAKNVALADIDGNGTVNVSDVTALVNLILK